MSTKSEISSEYISQKEKNGKNIQLAAQIRKHYPSSTRFLITVISLLYVVLICGCKNSTVDDLYGIDLNQYKPIDEFSDAYYAIRNRNEINTSYDIEKTIRIINAMELAQAKSENFSDFMDYMAAQDYTGVAPDVLEAKCKLFPLLEYTYKLQNQYEQMGNTWLLMRGFAQASKAFSSNLNLSTFVGPIHDGIFSLFEIAVNNNLYKTVEESMNSFEEGKELKGNVRQELEKLKLSYRNYLEYYFPIYKKYMHEYDALCVEKDQIYFDLYGGRIESVLQSTQNILKKYPTNSETMLLRSMALIIGSDIQTQLKPSENNHIGKDTCVLLGSTDTIYEPLIMNSRQREASNLLEKYNSLYPDRTAPSLVLEGMLYLQLGDEQTALLRFNQAAAEYPRQADRLTDMLDAYNMRSYLTKTPEGQYLRRLYASTMEGYGLFSPNLLKAIYHNQKGRVDDSRQEIYSHFFRRGNQGVYDELLSDMQFCEENLYGPFKSLLLEQSYIDVSIAPVSKWIFWDSDNTVRVSINNRSDIKLENVRIFLCIHYTDMYKDEYDVVKVPKSLNVIEPRSVADFGTIELAYPGKKFNDITRIRAIAMTDDRICWIDEVGYKKGHVLSTRRGEGENPNKQQKQAKEEFLNRYSLEPKHLQNILSQDITVMPPEDDPVVKQSWWMRSTKWLRNPDNKLKIELPRTLVMVDPVFSINPLDNPNALQPEENYLLGTSIHLDFDYVPEYNGIIPFYIYTDVADFRVEIIYLGEKSTIKNIAILRQ